MVEELGNEVLTGIIILSRDKRIITEIYSLLNILSQGFYIHNMTRRSDMLSNLVCIEVFISIPMNLDKNLLCGKWTTNILLSRNLASSCGRCVVLLYRLSMLAKPRPLGPYRIQWQTSVSTS